MSCWWNIPLRNGNNVVLFNLCSFPYRCSAWNIELTRHTAAQKQSITAEWSWCAESARCPSRRRRARWSRPSWSGMRGPETAMLARSTSQGALWGAAKSCWHSPTTSPARYATRMSVWSTDSLQTMPADRPARRMPEPRFDCRQGMARIAETERAAVWLPIKACWHRTSFFPQFRSTWWLDLWGWCPWCIQYH